MRLAALGDLPLILPTDQHGLRATVDTVFAAVRARPRVVAEIDSLALLMGAVRERIGATLQPGTAAPVDDLGLFSAPLAEEAAARDKLLARVSDDELSPAALAARVVAVDVARELVASGLWRGAPWL